MGQCPLVTPNANVCTSSKNVCGSPPSKPSLHTTRTPEKAADGDGGCCTTVAEAAVALALEMWQAVGGEGRPANKATEGLKKVRT